MARWKPSNTAKRKFAQQMREIEDFCSDNGITQSYHGDSYYFTLDGVSYRVSNHSVDASDMGAYNHLGEQVREKYHNGRNDETVYIHASKTRIIEIYNNLKNGHKLNGKGNIVNL